jgi:hypothetical protein
MPSSSFSSAPKIPRLILGRKSAVAWTREDLFSFLWLVLLLKGEIAVRMKERKNYYSNTANSQVDKH